MTGTPVVPTQTAPTAAPKPALMRKAQDHVRNARAAVALSLICTAVACGYGSYRLLSDLEAELGYAQYDYVALSFGRIFDGSVDEKVSSIQVLGRLVELSCSSNVWPNCSIPLQDFQYLGQKELSIVGLEAVAVSPLLTSEQVDPFEKFAYDFFDSEGEPTLGVHGFGKGIFTFDPGGSGELIHDVDSSNAKGKRDILAPLLQIASHNDYSEVVMFNTYAEPKRAAMIDKAIDCGGDDGDRCVVVSDILKVLEADQTRPSSLMASPLRSHGSVVGVIIAVMYWGEIITGAVPSSADQIHAVLHNAETDEQFTYVFKRGELKYVGEGDYSSGDFPDLERTYTIQQFDEGVYSITISPTTEFMDDYQTYAPIVASIAAVFIIMLTSVVFFSYDYFVKSQSRMHYNIMQSKRMFVRYISHEIRTPLNTVHLGMKVLYEELCDVLKLVGSTPGVGNKIESMIEFIMDIDESNDCAVGVLNDLINYDKIVVGSLALDIGCHHALSLITDTVRPYKVQAYKRRISLVVNTDIPQKCAGDNSNAMPSLSILGDDMKLKQVLRNVISNALKFTKDGGAITVTVFWNSDEYLSEECSSTDGQPAGSISIEVADTGVGLSAESLAIVGGEYVQVNARDLQSGGGSGLGLWISKNIVDLHKGTMVVSSAGVGCGTTVTIVLPVYTNVSSKVIPSTHRPTLRDGNDAREKFSDSASLPHNSLVKSDRVSPAEPPSNVPNDTASKDQRSSKRAALLVQPHPSSAIKTILVVDDVSSTRKIVLRMLSRAGYECLEAVDGQDCLEVVAKHGNIDLVLMDNEMPVMNGPDATRVISERWGAKLPVVGLTGNALPKDLDYFKSSGAIEVLVKPLNLKRFSTIIECINASSGKST